MVEPLIPLRFLTICTVTKEEYERILEAVNIEEEIAEDVDMETLQCSTGACPI